MVQAGGRGSNRAGLRLEAVGPSERSGRSLPRGHGTIRRILYLMDKETLKDVIAEHVARAVTASCARAGLGPFAQHACDTFNMLSYARGAGRATGVGKSVLPVDRDHKVQLIPTCRRPPRSIEPAAWAAVSPHGSAVCAADALAPRASCASARWHGQARHATAIRRGSTRCLGRGRSRGDAAPGRAAGGVSARASCSLLRSHQPPLEPPGKLPGRDGPDSARACDRGRSRRDCAGPAMSRCPIMRAAMNP